MNATTSRNPVHVFLEQAVRVGPGIATKREPLTGMEPCLEYYDIKLVERFRCESGAKLVYHFIAPDAESVRHVARRHAERFDTLWLASGGENDDKAARVSQPIYAAIYNRRVSRDTFVRQRVFVSEDGHRLLTFCALAEFAAEADETFAVWPERHESDIEWQYDIWRACG